jgi:predicted component of type VI protein secretion system
VERARWTDERHDDRMTVIDTTFDRVFEELRAERAQSRVEHAEFKAEMRTWRAEIRADMAALNERIGRLEERVSQLGFRAAGILAAGLSALVATQLGGGE